MLARQVSTDAKTGEVTESWIDIPGVLTPDEGVVATAQAAQLDANAASLTDQAATALAGLRTYRDNAAPTNAQTVAAVKLLCRVAIALIRLKLAKFDATD